MSDAPSINDNRAREKWFGLLVAALMAVPLGVWGIYCIVTERHDTTSRFSGVIHEVGAPAITAGIFYLAICCAILSVAASQWPRIRIPAIGCATLATLTAVITFGWRLSH